MAIEETPAAPSLDPGELSKVQAALGVMSDTVLQAIQEASDSHRDQLTGAAGTIDRLVEEVNALVLVIQEIASNALRADRMVAQSYNLIQAEMGLMHRLARRLQSHTWVLVALVLCNLTVTLVTRIAPLTAFPGWLIALALAGLEALGLYLLGRVLPPRTKRR